MGWAMGSTLLQILERLSLRGESVFFDLNGGYVSYDSINLLGFLPNMPWWHTEFLFEQVGEMRRAIESQGKGYIGD
jgi:hypothetical protein